MAPELVDPKRYGGDGQPNVRTDIYAFGMTCLEVRIINFAFNNFLFLKARKMSGILGEHTISRSKCFGYYRDGSQWLSVGPSAGKGKGLPLGTIRFEVLLCRFSGPEISG